MGVSRGGRTTKIHTIVDGLGNPVAFMLTSGHVFNSVPTIDLLSQLDIANSNMIGDKAYGTQAIRQFIDEQGASYTISLRENPTEPWDVDWSLYLKRHLVECFF